MGNERIFAAVFISLGVMAYPAFPDDDPITIQPVTVTASHILDQSEGRSTRSLDQDNSLYFDNSLVDSRARGPNGVQNDISMRGAPFEETMVLLDGTRVNDPQTGHFSSDIPLTSLDVRDIDVVYGPSSAYAGSSGMGGTVNVITRPLSMKSGIIAKAEGGSYDYSDAAVSVDLPVSLLKNRVSVERAGSSGYMPETEFDRFAATVNSRIETEAAYADFLFGYLKKDFGADSFYSDVYNNEEEHTDTRFFKLDTGYSAGDVTIRPVAYFRRHWDHFILDRNVPDFSNNFHKNYIYGTELSVSMDMPLGRIAYGTDLAREEIHSTSLGNHARDRQAVFLESVILPDPWGIQTGVRADHYSSFGWELNPSAGVSLELSPTAKLRSSIGRSFRAPSFTELYSTSPANTGNPALRSETAWSYEAGGDLKNDHSGASLTGFIRFTDNVIDWTRQGTSKVWLAGNIGKFDVYGFELTSYIEPCKITPLDGLKKIEVKYGYIQSFEHQAVTSKYVLNYLKHNLVCWFEFELFGGIMQRVSLEFKRRIDTTPYLLVNTEIYKDIDLKRMKTRLYFEGENLTNTDYTEVGSVRMPGIWLKAGVKYEF